MRRTLAWAALFPLLVAPAAAQQSSDAGSVPPQGAACAYNSVLPQIADGRAGWIQCDSSGRLIISNPGAGGGGGGAAADQSATNSTDAQAVRSDNQHSVVFNYGFNGTTWDRARLATGGAWLTQVQNFPTTQAVTQSGAFTVTQGPAGAAAWKVDGSAVTQPVSGTVTANLGTLNGAATATLQSNVQSAPGVSAATALGIQGVTGGIALAVSEANGANAALGNTGDTAYTGTGSASTVSALKGVYAALATPTPITPTVSGPASSSAVLKASSGSLLSVSATCTSTCWLMVFNASATPADGATTAGTATGNLQECVPIPANGTGGINYTSAPPEAFTTGITAVISSTACGTKTASAVGFINGRAR